MQKKKEALYEYNDIFTKVEVEVRGLENELRYWIFQKGLRSNYMFIEKIGLGGAYNLKDLHLVEKI